MSYDTYAWNKRSTRNFIIKCKRINCERFAKRAKLLRVWGTFSVKMTPISEQMVDEKVDSVMETGADYLIGADCGCLLNIGGRIERLGKEVKVMHIAEVLNSRS